MILSAMVVEVKAYSGEQSDARVKAAINTIYRMLRNMLKWPHLLIPAATPITLVADQQQYTLAANFKWPYRFWVVNPADGNPIYIDNVKHVLNNVNKGTTWRYRLKKKDAGTAATRGAWVIDLEEIPNTSFVGMYTYLYYDYYYTPDDLSGATDQTKFDDDFDAAIILIASVLLVAKQTDSKAFVMISKMAEEAHKDIIQKAIELYGEGIIVKPGSEITDDFPSISDYGRKLMVG